MTAFSYRDVSTMRAKALMVQLQYWLIHTGCVCPPAMAMAMVECRVSNVEWVGSRAVARKDYTDRHCI